MAGMQVKRKNVGRNGLYPPKEYQTAHLYIIDDIDPNAQPALQRNRRRVPAHTHKCNIIRDLFKDSTNCEVHSVRFPQGTRGREFFAYWRNELSTKTANDVVIIYFHGSAGGEEEEYKWTLTQYPRIQINAFELIKMVTGSNADSYFLLDCFIHTRWTHKFHKEAVGHNEISARPENMVHPDGRPMDHDGEFTESLVENIEKFLDNVTTRSGPWRNRKKMISIPDIMAKDEGIFSNPVRISMSRTRFGDTEQVKRFRFDPVRARRDGQLEFVTVIIQGPPDDILAQIVRAMAERGADKDGEGGEFDDEALGGMDDDDDDDADDDEEDGGGSGGTAVDVNVPCDKEGNAGVDGDEGAKADLFVEE